MSFIRVVMVSLVAGSVLTAAGAADAPAEVPARAPAHVLARASPRPSAPWRWPIRPEPPVLARFQLGPAPWSPGHRGADLTARAGQPIRAPAAGVVRFVGTVAGRPLVSIDHDGGVISSFEPVVSALVTGDEVAAGAVVGRLSPVPGHCTPRACLHWGVRVNGLYVDPLPLVGWSPPPIILLPLLAIN